MSYRIILDSCGELTEEMKNTGNFINVPLTLQVGEVNIIDDETFDQANFLNLVASSTECHKSACPSPEQYIKAFDCECNNIYVVTLSAPLSGSYNSACLAQKLYEETNPYVNIHVFSSRSASAGETLIGMKIEEYEKAGLEFDEIVKKVESYIERLTTTFVLEDLTFLERNGRLTGFKRFAANLLHIVPIMGATPEGTICQLDHARGMKKAMSKLVELILDYCKKLNPGEIVISHCNCAERAAYVKEKINGEFPDIKIYINDTRGVASLYAGNGGIIISL